MGLSRIWNKVWRVWHNYYPFFLGFVSAIVFNLLVTWCAEKDVLRPHCDWKINSAIHFEFCLDANKVSNGDIESKTSDEIFEVQIQSSVLNANLSKGHHEVI